MTNAIKIIGSGTGNGPNLPAHLQGHRNAALSGASAQIKNVEAYPMVKLDKGLWLTKGGEKLGRKSAVVHGADGVAMREPDIMDFVILGWTEVTYSYFAPGQAMGSGKPLCFSVGGAVPHALAPQKQATACKGCPKNAEGSGQNGKGKACGKRCVVVGFDYADPERTIVGLQVPTISNWFSPKNDADWYGLRDLIKLYQTNETDPYMLVTRVKAAEEDNKPRLSFRPVGYVTESDMDFIGQESLAKVVSDFRDFYEYKLESAAQPQVATAGAVAPAGVDPQAIATLMSMAANPATADAAIMALGAMGINLQPAAPAVDPLIPYRAAFPGVPDAALTIMMQSGVPATPVLAANPAVQAAAAVVSQQAGLAPVETRADSAATEAPVATPQPALTENFTITPPVAEDAPVLGATVPVEEVPAGDVDGSVDALRGFLDAL